MTKRILIGLSVVLLLALVVLAREVSRMPVAGSDHPAAVTTASPSVRVVLPANVFADTEFPQAVEGMPELPAPTVATLATMPATAPAHPETIELPNR